MKICEQNLSRLTPHPKTQTIQGTRTWHLAVRSSALSAAERLCSFSCCPGDVHIEPLHLIVHLLILSATTARKRVQAFQELQFLRGMLRGTILTFG